MALSKLLVNLFHGNKLNAFEGIDVFDQLFENEQ